MVFLLEEPVLQVIRCDRLIIPLNRHIHSMQTRPLTVKNRPSIKGCLTLTFLVAHGDVGVEQGSKGALFGVLGLGCQSIVPQSLDEQRGQVQSLGQ